MEVVVFVKKCIAPLLLFFFFKYNLIYFKVMYLEKKKKIGLTYLFNYIFIFHILLFDSQYLENTSNVPRYLYLRSGGPIINDFLA